MAWLDDRVWCHPKMVGLSDKAFRVYVHALGYASGFATGGVLTGAQQTILGSTAKVRGELVAANLWDELGDGDVAIHGWDEHNGRHDRSRAANRERKRRQRQRDNGVTDNVTWAVTEA